MTVITTVHPVHEMNVDQHNKKLHKMAAILHTKSIDLGCELAVILYTHHRSSLLGYTQPESWYSFYRPRKS